MSIYDLYPYRSLVKHFQHSGFDVYLVDWGQLTYQHCHLNFMAHSRCKCNCIQLILQRQSRTNFTAWLEYGRGVAMLYVADNQPAHIKTLWFLGSPVDSYARGDLVNNFQLTNQLISKYPKLQHTLYSGKIPTFNSYRFNQCDWF